MDAYMSKRSMSGKGGNSRGSADSWMALAVARSWALRAAISSIMSPRAATVVLMPFASEVNSTVSCGWMRSLRLPSVIFANDPFVSSMRLTTTRFSSAAAKTPMDAMRRIARMVNDAMMPRRLAYTISDDFIIMTKPPS